MDPGKPKRTMRFKPGPPKPSQRPNPNTEAEAEAEGENRRAARRIANRLGVGRGRSNTGKKSSSSSQVTFQPSLSLPGIRSFGVPKEDDNSGSDVNPSSSSAALLPATVQKDEEVQNLVTRTEEGYVEPWDYNSNCPIVLPWRKPNSGDPELLDQEEFGNVAKNINHGEKRTNPAEKLGLTSEQQGEKQMFLIKIPDLPVMKQSTGVKTKRSESENSSNRNNPFEGLPEGFMGKMQVYKSGAVKLKLGDVLYNVSPGLDMTCQSDVAAVDTEGKTFCQIGSLSKSAILIPDVDSLLKSDSEK